MLLVSAMLPKVRSDIDLDAECLFADIDTVICQSSSSSVSGEPDDDITFLQVFLDPAVNRGGITHFEDSHYAVKVDEESAPERLIGQPEHDEISSRSTSPARTSWSQLALNEIQFEVSDTSKMAIPRKSKAVLAVLEAAFFPACFGVDRCYMRQPCLGAIKGLTLGGFGLWYFVDYAAFLINALEQSETMNVVGIHAYFGPTQLETSMLIMVVSLGVQALSFVFCGSRAVRVRDISKPEDRRLGGK